MFVQIIENVKEKKEKRTLRKMYLTYVNTREDPRLSKI